MYTSIKRRIMRMKGVDEVHREVSVFVQDVTWKNNLIL